MSKKIIYEKHPVSKERKRELISQGYKIIDARFDPEPKKQKPEPEKKNKKSGNSDDIPPVE